MDTEKKEILQKIINESNRIVFFGGAGVSTESGIPDFRSVDGLYNQQWAYPPETIISHSFYEQMPEEFWRFYRAKLLIDSVEPNEAHRKLAELEAAGKMTGVVTQNIDGLHQAAGSRKVWELHGSTLRNYCQTCGRFYNDTELKTIIDGGKKVPLCQCGGRIKPDVVLYEEGLDNDVVNGAIDAISEADTMIIGGTSLVVYPAASLIRYFHGEHLVLINKSETQADSMADLVIHDSIGKVLGAIKI